MRYKVLQLLENGMFKSISLFLYKNFKLCSVFKASPSVVVVVVYLRGSKDTDRQTDTERAPLHWFTKLNISCG